MVMQNRPPTRRTSNEIDTVSNTRININIALRLCVPQ